MFLAGLAALDVSAKPRTANEIIAAANGVFQTSIKSKAFGLKTAPMKILRSDSQLSIAGYADGGFVVIANDDRFDAVLGYSDSQFDNDKLAPGFVWWLEATNASLQKRLDNGTNEEERILPAASQRASVDELMKTRWGQDAPYNDQCPKYTQNGKQNTYVTGCVATAMAQILKYHAYPTSGKGSANYAFTSDVDGTIKRLTANFAKANYDYDNMLDVYTPGEYNDTQAEAVSLLMSHLGIGLKMSYTVDGSGSYLFDACRVMRKNFKANPYTEYFWASCYTKKEMMAVIYREINDNCPVLYGGVSNSGGHAFVFDGYDARGNVHVNWGWDGQQDGFFDITSLNGYGSQQQMVVMRPDTDTRYAATYRSRWGLWDGASFTVKNNYGTLVATANGGLINIDVDAFSGNIGLIAARIDDGEQAVLAQYSVSSMAGFGPNVNGYQSSFELSGSYSSLADGEYRVYLASKGNKEVTWQPVRSSDKVSNSYIMKKVGSNASLTKENSSDWTATTGIEGVTVVPSAALDGTTRVYDSTGRIVYTAPTASFSVKDVPAHGILIIKNGSLARKIVKP